MKIHRLMLGSALLLGALLLAANAVLVISNNRCPLVGFPF